MSQENPTGAHRVAAFLLSLDRERQASVLQHMDRATLDKVAQAMTELDERLTTPESVKNLYLELARSVSSPQGLRAPCEDELEDILGATLGADLAAQVVGDIRDRRRQAQPFIELEKHAPDRIAAALEDEPTAISALVLAHLDPETSAGALACYEPERALEIVEAIAAFRPPPAPVIDSLARSLENKLSGMADMPAAPDASVSLKTIAQMLTFSPPETEQAVLEGIESENEQMAAEIREFMFTWNDLSAVDKRSMQKILATVDTKTLAMSLKGCDAEVESNIISNLSSRVQEMVIDERELLGPVSMSEVTAARGELLKGVRSLMETGEFKPARAGEEMVT